MYEAVESHDLPYSEGIWYRKIKKELGVGGDQKHKKKCDLKQHGGSLWGNNFNFLLAIRILKISEALIAV